MFEVRREPWRAGPWLRVVRGAAPDWKRLYRGYQAAVDWPTCHYFRELAEAYPEALFVLTTRESASWYDSTRRTLYALWEVLPRWVALLPLAGSVRALIVELIWQRTFEGRFLDRDRAIARYERHQAEVIEALPPERLLVFGVEEGWDPLCAFLGVDSPTGPFPWVNEAKEIERAVRAVRLGIPILYGLVGLSLCVVAWCLLGTP